MAIRHSTRAGKRAAPSPCEERRLKVYASHYAPRANEDHAANRPVPWVQLKGDWLARAGFAIHAALKVRVMRGCIVVTVEEPADGER